MNKSKLITAGMFACLLAAHANAAISFSGTALQSGNPNASVVNSTSVGVLINLDSGTDWSAIRDITPGTAFTIGSQFTINTTSFTVFGRNTATGLGSISGAVSNFSFTGGMSASDQFAMLIFPNAAQANSVSGGTSLTLFRMDSPLAWTLPANDTSGSTFQFGGATPSYTQVPNTATALQSFTVVPEPSTYALLAMSGLAMGGYIVRRRRRA
jgi:hypothetical protein